MFFLKIINYELFHRIERILLIHKLNLLFIIKSINRKRDICVWKALKTFKSNINVLVLITTRLIFVNINESTLRTYCYLLYSYESFNRTYKIMNKTRCLTRTLIRYAFGFIQLAYNVSLFIKGAWVVSIYKLLILKCPI